MADAKSATRGRPHRRRKDFAAILAGPHYWITLKTSTGRVVRIPVEGKRRKAVGKRGASKATVRPFGGTQGRDVQYRAPGAAKAAADPKVARQSRYDRLITKTNQRGTSGTKASEWMPVVNSTHRTPTGGMVDRGELATRRKGVADVLRQSRARRAASASVTSTATNRIKPAAGQQSFLDKSPTPTGLTAAQQSARERAQAAIQKHVDKRLASARKRAGVSLSTGRPSAAFDAVAEMKRRKKRLGG